MTHDLRNDILEIGFSSVADLLESQSRSLAAIERHLSVLAELAQLTILEKTGEKTFQVQRFVVGRDGEDNPCVWLYSTHPGLEFAVTRVYHEYIGQLPLSIPADAKVWDGEQAPSVDKAARGGYFNLAPAPFTISLMPTGKKTDAGHDVRRFSRVISIDGGAPETPPPAPSPAGAPAPREQSDRDFDGLPGHDRSAYKPATPPPAPAEGSEPANGNKPAYLTEPRPWAGDVAVEALRYVADAKQRKGEGLEETDGKFGVVIGALDSHPFDTECRHEFLRAVFDVTSARQLTGAQRLALVVWAKPAKTPAGWKLAETATTEYRRILGWADGPETGADDDIPF